MLSLIATVIRNTRTPGYPLLTRAKQTALRPRRGYPGVRVRVVRSYPFPVSSGG
jgi:hypothetical protein